MNKNVMTAVVVIVILLGLAAVVKKSHILNRAPSPTPAIVETTSPSPATSASPSASPTVSKKTVTITASGFNPQTITIKVGDSVTWVNSDSSPHTVNSNPHPTHTAFSPLNLGAIQPGASKSLTFTQAGTFGYHDHLNPSLTGTVVVQ